MSIGWLRGLDWRRELVTYAVVYLALFGLASLLGVPRTPARLLGDVALLVALRLVMHRWLPALRR